MSLYPYRQEGEPALDYYTRVARLADADAEYQASREQAGTRLRDGDRA